MRFVLVTGLSGAGRTQAIRRLEDLGFFCVDNLPPALMPSFARLCLKQGTQNVAAAVDMRMGVMFNDIYDVLNELKSIEGVTPEILYMDASDEVLIRRFKETRRSHPLAADGNITAGVAAERDKLHRIKGMAQNVVDTSTYTPRKLGEVIDTLFSSDEISRILITVISFGFKRGIPLDADMVFDMRFIPNPFYEPELKDKTGLSAQVREFVFAQPRTRMFIDQVSGLVNFVAPFYLEQDKKQLVIAIGCTGGMHRSVAVAQELYEIFLKQGHRVSLEHRDIGLDLQRRK